VSVPLAVLDVLDVLDVPSDQRVAAACYEAVSALDGHPDRAPRWPHVEAHVSYWFVRWVAVFRRDPGAGPVALHDEWRKEAKKLGGQDLVSYGELSSRDRMKYVLVWRMMEVLEVPEVLV
jgi:hypothetical protein